MALKGAGVGRISINPQSFNDEVLDSIGRRHTSKQTLDAFALARKCGFNNINMDLIAGLPKIHFRHLKTVLTLPYPRGRKRNCSYSCNEIGSLYGHKRECL